MTSSHTPSTSARATAAWRIAAATMALGLIAAPIMLAQTTPTTTPRPAPPKPAAAVTPPPGAKAFATAQAAVDALLQAASTFDEPALIAIFGPDNKDLDLQLDKIDLVPPAIGMGSRCFSVKTKTGA